MDNSLDSTTEPTKEVRFLLPSNTHRRLRVEAAKNDLPMTEVVRQLVLSWIEKQEAGHGQV